MRGGMNYKYEFYRLLDSVNQFLVCPRSKAALQVLKNASQYYKESRPTVRRKSPVQQRKGEILQYLNMAIGAINGRGPITAVGYIKQAIAKLSPVA